MSLEGEDVLQQLCAAVSTLWIFVWAGAETGLLLVDDHDTVFECVGGSLLERVDDMIGIGNTELRGRSFARGCALQA